MNTATLPRAATAEASYLGALLRFPDRAGEILSHGVAPADLIDPFLCALLRALIEQHGSGGIDLARLRRQLDIPRSVSGDLAKDALDDLIGSVCTSAHAACDAQQILDASRKRKLIAISESMAEWAKNGHTADDIFANVTADLDDFRRECEAGKKQETYNAAELIEWFPTLNQPIIDGIFRRGEVVNVVSGTKAGKSWLMLGMAWSIAAGEPWLGLFLTTQSRVLLIDNELMPNTLAHRVRSVAEALSINYVDYTENLVVRPIRGKRRTLQDELSRIERGEFDVLILDSKYRFRRPGTEENSNDDQTEFYDLAEEHAERLNAGIVFSGHASKGNQAEKNVTDVGSGGGAQSRAVDAHVILRPHEEADHVVLDAALRSFAPIEPVVLRWCFPVWHVAGGADPTRLKGKQTRSEERQRERDASGRRAILAALESGSATGRQLRAKTQLGKDRLQKLLDELVESQVIISAAIKIRGNETIEYSLPK